MYVALILAVSLLLQTGSPQPPDPVLSLRQRMLSKESYMNLSRQWIDFMDKTGESVDGHLNAGQALRYAGEKKPVYLKHYEKAVALDSNDVRALDLCGFHTWNKGTPEERERGLRMLERAKILDSRYEPILYSLYSVYCCEGRLDDAEVVAGDMYRRAIISVPLQDFGYNLLAGLPENAVLITNGDNDTYPPISLQVGIGFRTDVTVLNRSLLECEEYTNALADRYSWFPDSDDDSTKHSLGMAGRVIQTLLNSKKRPIYSAISLNYGEQPHSITIQGLVARIDGLSKNEQNIDYQKIYELFRDIYRLDSCSYWGYPWELRNAERLLIKNYAVLAFYGAEKALEHKDKTAASWLIRFGTEISEFHEDAEMISMFSELTHDEK